MPERSPIAVVAGTGFYNVAQLENPTVRDVTTEYGTARITLGRWHGLEVGFVTRHGTGHSVPPHMINYRANIAALAELGVTDVFAINAVGSINPQLETGELVCINDFLDFTKNRVTTFFDGSGPRGVVHVDVADTYHPELRAEWLAAAQAVGIPLRDGGVYCCFEGPRFESPAEVRMAGILGGDVAGMTGIPEATLAVEAGLRYSSVSLVCNPCAGLSPIPITVEDVNQVLADSGSRLLTILDEVLRRRSL